MIGLHTNKRGKNIKISNESPENNNIDLALFNQLYANSPGIIILYHFTSRTYYLNNKAQQVFSLGSKNGEYKNIGKELAEVSDQVLFKELVQKPDFNNLSKYSKFESEITVKKGKSYYYLWNNTIIHDENNEPIYVLLSGVDITERHISEITLRESYERIDLIINSANDLVFILDKNQRFIAIYGDWSDKGISKDFFIERSPEEIFTTSYEIHKEAYDKALSGKNAVYDWFINNPVHGKLYVQTSLSPIKENSTIIGVIAISRDVTEKRKVEEAIMMSQLYIDNASDRIHWVNPDGSFYYINKAAYEGLGYTKEELLAKKVTDIDPSSRIENWSESWERMKKAGSMQLESVHQRKDGSLIPVEITANYFKFDSKELLCTSVRNISDRKEAEKYLKDNQEKLKSTLSSMDDLVFVINNKGIIIDYHKPSDNFKFFTTSKTFIGFHYNDVLPVHIIKSFEKAFSRIESGESLIDFDYTIEINREKRWFNARISKFLDNMGEYAGVIVVSRNITRRKKVEQAIKESEEKFRTISDQSLMGIIIIQQGKLRYYNGAFCKLTGYSCDEIDSWEEDELFKIVHDKDIDFFVEQYKLRLTVSKNKVLNFIYRGKTKQGEIKWMEQWSKIITYEGKSANLVTFIDIDERKKAEHALKESETRLKLALEGAHEGLIDWNIKDSHVYYSKEWITMLGYDKSDLEPSIGAWLELVHPDDVDKVNEILNAHLEGESEYYKTEHRLRTKSGEWKWVLAHGKIVERNEQNVALRAIGTQIDISEQKEYEQKLKELNATKDKFFSIIAHDLKNPFNQFSGISALILENFDTYTREELFDFIQLLNKISDKTNALLENLLEWAMSQTDRITFSPEKIDLKHLIMSINSLFENQLEIKNIRLIDELESGIDIFADENMIKSVYRNLLSNAIKYTPDKGEIIVKNKVDNNKVEVSIIDTGVGIDEADIDKLFRIDVQYSSDGTRNEKGTGLGLLLCKEFVEKNGGEIKVKSEKYNGSEFIFTVPIYTDKEKKKVIK